MQKSKNLCFEYLQSGQAHKHITVNDALLLLDALSSVVFLEANQPLPEPTLDGEAYVFSNEGEAHKGNVFISSGGVYFELQPQTGWRAQGQRFEYVFNGSNWDKVSGFAPIKSFAEFNDGGLVSDIIIPQKSIVFGVTARVLEDIQGQNVASWSIGVNGDLTRYGTDLWLGQGGWSKGLTGSPITYWDDTSIVISPNEGQIDSGKIEIWIYGLELDIPF